MTSFRVTLRCLFSVLAAMVTIDAGAAELAFPPKLPGGRTVVTDKSPKFLKPVSDLHAGVEIARTPPAIDFLYYPEQTYPGHPWSVWGDSLAVGGKYYSAIGDHTAPQGNAFLYEYDPDKKTLRTLVDVKKLLGLPAGHYVPGKIHSRIDMGSDGWLYFATHRGSTRVTIDKYHYKGDWIVRHHPKTGKTEIVAQGPVPKHCIPTSVLDPDRLIFYGGTAAGNRQDPVQFFAYDIRKRKVLHTAENGPYRYMIFARSTGRVYYVAEDGGPLMRYDPSEGKPPTQIPGKIGLRSATQETADGYVYTVSTRGDATLWRFNTKTEKIDRIGNAAVGSQTYVTSLDVDPTGRYLYYVCGAHGGGQQDGTPIVQFDVKTGKKKVIAFLHPFYKQKYGYVPLGTFGSAISEKGDKLYITWNGNRGGADGQGRLRFDTCALTVIHIPESERRP
ncbi:MAG: hypothetical protein IH987_04820 [Planctomycetes bacterium]|nr:hypothetical protein [Planctomycetota bacterium]